MGVMETSEALRTAARVNGGKVLFASPAEGIAMIRGRDKRIVMVNITVSMPILEMHSVIRRAMDEGKDVRQMLAHAA